MTANGWFQIGLYLLLLLAITKPMGVYMARVFSGEKTFMDPMMRPVERLLYRLTGVDETHEMRWTEYATAMLLLSVVSMILLVHDYARAAVASLEPAALRSGGAGFGF